MVFFTYENRKIDSFAKFHELRNKERKKGFFKEFPIPDKYPKVFRDMVKKNNELRDYLQFINLGGPESPEQFRDIYTRSKKNGMITTPEDNQARAKAAKSSKALPNNVEFA